MYTSQIYMNSFSIAIILLGVAVNKDRGEASSDSRLRYCIEILRLPGEMLNKITLRNLIRSAGAALPAWSIYTNGHFAVWMDIC
mgnify:CR=1 FL=1